MTLEEKNKKQREYRKLTANTHTKVYEKTLNGYLMRMYHNMKSRISGIQKQKAHLYLGKSLLTKEDFYLLCKQSTTFLNLWDVYVKNNYKQTLAPTVDRVDSSIGYEINNMEFVTHSENSRRGALNKCQKPLL